MRISPPLSPSAVMRLSAVCSMLLVTSMLIVPPLLMSSAFQVPESTIFFALALMTEELSVPVLMMAPPSITILPSCSVILLACILPLLLTTEPSSSLAAEALIMTVPPSASITPLFVIWALYAVLSTFIATRPQVSRSRVIPSPAAKPLEPLVVIILPVFVVQFPSRAMNPLDKAPWFIMDPFSPFLKNAYFSARKSLSLIARVEATSPPTFTLAPGVNNMPFGFTRKTLPFAVSVPKIDEGSFPETLLSRVDWLEG